MPHHYYPKKKDEKKMYIYKKQLAHEHEILARKQRGK